MGGGGGDACMRASMCDCERHYSDSSRVNLYTCQLYYTTSVECACMLVYVCIRIKKCVCVCVCVCVYACVSFCVYVCLCVHVCKSECIRI